MIHLKELYQVLYQALYLDRKKRKIDLVISYCFKDKIQPGKDYGKRKGTRVQMTKQQPDLENARLVSKEGREQQLEASVESRHELP